MGEKKKKNLNEFWWKCILDKNIILCLNNTYSIFKGLYLKNNIFNCYLVTVKKLQQIQRQIIYMVGQNRFMTTFLLLKTL